MTSQDNSFELHGLEIIDNPVPVDLARDYTTQLFELASTHPDLMAATFAPSGVEQMGNAGYSSRRVTPGTPIRNLQDEFTIGMDALANWEHQLGDAPERFKQVALMGREILLKTGDALSRWIDEQPDPMRESLLRNNGVAPGKLPKGLRHIAIKYASLDDLHHPDVPPIRRRYINFPHHDSSTLTLHHYETYPGLSVFERPYANHKADPSQEYEIPFGASRGISVGEKSAIIFPGRDFVVSLPGTNISPLLHGVEVGADYGGERISAATFLYPTVPKVKMY